MRWGICVLRVTMDAGGSTCGSGEGKKQRGKSKKSSQGTEMVADSL
jgi:hypothetical protein